MPFYEVVSENGDFAIKICVFHKVKTALKGHLQNPAALFYFNSKIHKSFFTHLMVTKGNYFQNMNKFYDTFPFMIHPTSWSAT